LNIKRVLSFSKTFETFLILRRTERGKIDTLPNPDCAHKNITSNFSQARSTLPEDGSQRIRNMSEFLMSFNVDFNL